MKFVKFTSLMLATCATLSACTAKKPEAASNKSVANPNAPKVMKGDVSKALVLSFSSLGGGIDEKSHKAYLAFVQAKLGDDSIKTLTETAMGMEGERDACFEFSSDEAFVKAKEELKKVVGTSRTTRLTAVAKCDPNAKSVMSQPEDVIKSVVVSFDSMGAGIDENIYGGFLRLISDSMYGGMITSIQQESTGMEGERTNCIQYYGNHSNPDLTKEIAKLVGNSPITKFKAVPNCSK
jgi:hypothetical protein